MLAPDAITATKALAIITFRMRRGFRNLLRCFNTNSFPGARMRHLIVFVWNWTPWLQLRRAPFVPCQSDEFLVDGKAGGL